MKSVFKNMKCCPQCTYFPNMDCKSFKFCEDGVKRRTDGKEFICGYDGHTITSWYDDCPKELDRLAFLAEKSRQCYREYNDRLRAKQAEEMAKQ